LGIHKNGFNQICRFEIIEVFLVISNSKYLFNPTESPLKKQFKIDAIPRYMLIDKNGKVIDDDAPRPSDKAIREVLDGLLK
jgi:hypothetical protein